MFRKFVASLLLVVATFSGPTAAMARPTPSVVRDARPIPAAEVVSRAIADLTPKERAALETYLDAVHRAAMWQAILALHAQWQALLSHFSARDGTWYTGPECPGRYRIPVYIVFRESRCQQMARNPSSSAGGWYQMVRGTFATAVSAAGMPQYAGMHAADAPAHAQHAAARWLIETYGVNCTCTWRLTA